MITITEKTYDETTFTWYINAIVELDDGTRIGPYTITDEELVDVKGKDVDTKLENYIKKLWGVK